MRDQEALDYLEFRFISESVIGTQYQAPDS